jgi:hypothetical protein
MSDKGGKNSEIEKNEQIRAIFVLGLLAVLASIRTQNATIMANIGNEAFNIIPIIDTMILLMSFYSLFMIFGYSKDMMGENVALFFKNLARSFLIMNFAILLAIGGLLAIVYYQDRLLWFMGLLALPVAYLAYRKARTLSFEILRELKSKKGLKSFSVTMSLLGVAICVLEISYYSPQDFVPIFFVLGAVNMILFLYCSLQNKPEKQEIYK